MTIFIRPATEEDAETIAAFNSAMAIETESVCLPEQVALPGAIAVFNDPRLGFYIVAETEGDISGSLMITYEWSDWSNEMYWWLQSVYVAPEHRRKGIYTALYSHVLNMARETGNVRGIKLYVYYDNKRAQSVYESLGMQRSRHHIYEAAVRPGERSRG